MVLEALEQPHRTWDGCKAAAMSCFLDWSAERLALAAAEETDALSTLIRAWAHVLEARGVAALQETITTSQGLPARLLTAPDGERRLTDLRHIGQALHGAAVAEGLGITALVAWLRRRIEEANKRTDDMEERSRRLDSDADAVQVVTIHRSKGLEFPIVYVPFGWDQYQPDILRPCYHDAQGDRVLDVGSGLDGSDPAMFSEGVFRHQQEEAGEQLRLLYVALTRARSQVVLWWAPATTARHAPLSRLLFGAASEGGEPATSVSVPSDGDAARVVQELAARSGGQLAVEFVTPQPPAAHWQRPARTPDDLHAAPFDRALDLSWRRTSYSGLTAAAHDGGGPALVLGPAVGSEPEDAGLDDEPDSSAPLVLGGISSMGAISSMGRGAAASVTSPMAQLPGGTSFGSLVHGVLETVDPSAADLTVEIGGCVDEQLRRWGPSGTPLDRAALTHALEAVYETPLGAAALDRRLRDFPLADRLTELSFELPLAGGDRPGSGLRLGALAPVVRRHLQRPGTADPLAAYSERFTDPLLRDQPLRGFLNGSLDAVLRVRDAAGSPRYVVVDYKTNWLGVAAPGSGQLTAADYTPDRLAAAMLASDYPLQALLYSVALHRYLRWRQPGYTPEQHLGGVLYLYLRGMCGPQTPVIDGQPCGVFSWQPPAALVTELSDLLDSGAVA